MGKNMPVETQSLVIQDKHAWVNRLLNSNSYSVEFQELKFTLHRKLLDRINLDLLSSMASDRMRTEVRTAVAKLVEEEKTPLSLVEKDRVIEEVLSEVFGLGPLVALLFHLFIVVVHHIVLLAFFFWVVVFFVFRRVIVLVPLLVVHHIVVVFVVGCVQLANPQVRRSDPFLGFAASVPLLWVGFFCCTASPFFTKHGVVWTNGKIIDVGLLPGDDRSTLASINSSGLAVGFSAAVRWGGCCGWRAACVWC